MEPQVARLSAAILAVAAVAVVGCGGEGRPGGSAAAPASQQAPDPERTKDLVPLTTAQAAREADRVALVMSRGSTVVEGAPGMPFTRTTFDVERVLKGELPRRIVIQVLGGRLGNTVVDSLVPAFARSARYILFLGPDGRVGPTIFPQSVLAVRRAGGADVVAPAPDGIRLLAAGSTRPARPLGGKPRLADVLFSLRRYLRTNGGSP